MEFGVSLPTSAPGMSGGDLVAWSREADSCGFDAVAVIDRFNYGNLEPLVTLGAVAAVTTRVELVTAVLVSPLREQQSVVEQVDSLQRISGGRLALGVGVGGREEDFAGNELPMSQRGKRLDAQLRAVLASPHRPRMIAVGGQSEPARRRLADFGDCYLDVGGPPETFRRRSQAMVEAWQAAGRPGRPQLWGTAYFALDGGQEEGRKYLRDYYAFAGNFSEKLVSALLDDPEKVREFARSYEEVGCDRLIFLSTASDPGQPRALARALGILSNESDR